jgi:amino acid adenylation domain-containing protein
MDKPKTVAQNKCPGLAHALLRTKWSVMKGRSQWLLRILEGKHAKVGHETMSEFTKAEMRQLLVEWNDTQAEFPSDKCVHELFEEQVERTPEAAAVVHEERGLNYGELNARANQLAHYLRELGVKPDERVAICVERGIEMVVGLLAVLKAGGAYVPLDPAYPAERLKYMLEDSAPTVLLTQGRLKGLFAERSQAPPVIDLTPDSPQWANQPETNPDRAGVGLTHRHLAYVIYTSGTTGMPKGVMVEHRAIANHMNWMKYAFPLHPEDNVVHKTPFSFDASVWEFYAPLLSGSCLIVANPGGHRDTVYLAELLQKNHVHTLQVTPALLSAMLDTPAFAACSSIKRVFCGGEALCERFIEDFYAQLPHADLINLYGPTETTIDATFWVCPKTSRERKHLAIGRPIANVRIYILDEQGEPVPIGMAGEIHIGGAGVARGYLNGPELTAERFVLDRFAGDAESRMYKTGDLGRWLPDGTIEFLGRNDFQLKVRGYRIEPAEIEVALAQHESVRIAVVTVRQESPTDTRIIAYVVPDGAGVPTTGDLRSFLLRKLPDYMVPSAFVFLRDLPLTPNGKVDRKALPSVDQVFSLEQRSVIVPRTPVEIALAKLWCELLKITNVGVHDNFFEVGGHSLLATQLVSRIRREFNVELPIGNVFERPTIESLALSILENQSRTTNPDDLEKMLTEIESLSDESAARLLLEAGQNAPDVLPGEEGPTRQRIISIFRCPTAKSELFGKRECNLVILINEDFEVKSFERVAHHVRELDPTIVARTVRDYDARGLVLPQRPTLTFSPAAIRHYPPQPGRVFCGYPLSKSEECEALARVGIAVPKWVLLTEDNTPDLSGFDGYVVRKPNYGGASAEVRLVRKERIRWKPVTTHVTGTSDSMIIQQFIYTGPLPTSYRVCTLFGRALYSIKSQAGADRPRLTTPADVASAIKQGRFTISANGRDGRSELNFDEEIIRLGERAHAAFPDIPLLGFDIVREVPSGRLYVLEANAIGYVWNFQSQQLADYGFSFEEQFDGIRKSAYILAENTQLHAR